MSKKEDLLRRIKDGSLLPQGATLEETRQNFLTFSSSLSTDPDIKVETIKQPSFCGEWLHPSRNGFSGKAILYLHGGSFAVGSPESTRSITSRVCTATSIPVFTLEQPLSPENPYPAALDAAFSAYQWLLERFAPEAISVIGDSSGSCIGLSLLLRIKAAGLSQPSCAAFISPWFDLSQSSNGIKSPDNDDPFMQKHGADLVSAGYLNGTSRTDPVASPYWGDPAGLPPLLLQIGSEEALVESARAYQKKATEAGVLVTLNIWEGLFHVWHAFYDFIPEDAGAAFREIATFVHRHCKSKD